LLYTKKHIDLRRVGKIQALGRRILHVLSILPGFLYYIKKAKKKIFVFFGGERQASSSAAAIIQL